MAVGTDIESIQVILLSKDWRNSVKYSEEIVQKHDTNKSQFYLFIYKYIIYLL